MFDSCGGKRGTYYDILQYVVAPGVRQRTNLVRLAMNGIFLLFFLPKTQFSLMFRDERIKKQSQTTKGNHSLLCGINDYLL